MTSRRALLLFEERHGWSLRYDSHKRYQECHGGCPRRYDGVRRGLVTRASQHEKPRIRRIGLVGFASYQHWRNVISSHRLNVALLYARK